MENINTKAGKIFGYVMLAGAYLSWIYAAYEYGLAKGYEEGHRIGVGEGIDLLHRELMKYNEEGFFKTK